MQERSFYSVSLEKFEAHESERNFIKLYALDDEFPPTLCVCCSETVFRFIKLRFKLY